MRLRDFVRIHQDELRKLVGELCPNCHPLTLKDLESWVLNDDGLYSWAIRAGWRG